MLEKEVFIRIGNNSQKLKRVKTSPIRTLRIFSRIYNRDRWLVPDNVLTRPSGVYKILGRPQSIYYILSRTSLIDDRVS